MAYIFVIVWVYLRSFFCGELRKTHLFWNIMHIGRSRSSKFVDFGTNRKGVCDFLLVINSNFGPILHSFWDTASYWLKIAYFSYPTLVWRPRSGEPITISGWNLVRKNYRDGATVWWKLHDPNFNRFLTDPPVWQTDGQTDRRNCDSICVLTAYAVARKNDLARFVTCSRQQLQFYIKLVIITSFTNLLHRFSLLFVTTSGWFPCKLEKFNEKHFENGVLNGFH